MFSTADRVLAMHNLLTQAFTSESEDARLTDCHDNEHAALITGRPLQAAPFSMMALHLRATTTQYCKSPD